MFVAAGSCHFSVVPLEVTPRFLGVDMGPTKHPSAWRLNKSEEKSVDSDLALWEANLPPGLSEEETLVKRKEQRKRLIRVIQEAKHEASLQRQQTAGAKSKAAAATAKKPAASAPQAPVAAQTSATHLNAEYYECVKQDMAVIEKVLGSNLKELMPTPIAAAINEKTGVQDTSCQSNKPNIVNFMYLLETNFAPFAG